MPNFSYLCTRFIALDHGVMVTLQVLVLSFWVRIPVVQRPINKSRMLFQSVLLLFLNNLNKKKNINLYYS